MRSGAVEPPGGEGGGRAMAPTPPGPARADADRLRAELARLAGRNAELEAVERLQEDFIALASHDLQSPLTAIRGYVQLLLRRVRSPRPDLARLEEGLEVVAAQAAALSALVQALLDVSRLQAGTLALQRAPCELGECLAAVLARRDPAERGRVALALADAPLAGCWDALRLEQVLANLLDNALKYSPPPERVLVSAERCADGVAVAVRDRGMGIAPADLPLLFRRFSRTPGARASGLPGTGLGLYLCRGIVEAHGGRLWAESAGVGRGATFRFVVPDQPPASDDRPGGAVAEDEERP